MSGQDPLSRIKAIMAALRDPTSGCPWDLKQSFDTIVPHTLEEAYEVADAIERGDYDALPGELGDLLFQVVFYARLGEEENRFDLDQVINTLCDKLERRHPHVFADAQLAGEGIRAHWEATKATERAAKDQHGLLDDIPHNLPALSRAAKIQKRVATVGFDWDSLGPVVEKVVEEIDEVMDEAQQAVVDQAKVEEELGDLLFAVTNLSRHLKVDPEQALRKANRKFERRFRGVESLCDIENTPIREAGLDTLESYWQRVKGGESND